MSSVLLTWVPNFSSPVEAAFCPVAGGTSRTRCTAPERDQPLVGRVALLQGALTWEQPALTPACPEARDAEGLTALFVPLSARPWLQHRDWNVHAGPRENKHVSAPLLAALLEPGADKPFQQACHPTDDYGFLAPSRWTDLSANSAPAWIPGFLP